MNLIDTSTVLDFSQYSKVDILTFVVDHDGLDMDLIHI